MKRICLILLTVLAACGGKLSDEQRKQMREGMEQQKIVQMSDSEIVTAALEQGQVVFNALKESVFNQDKVDSIARHYHVKIYWRVPGSGQTTEIEQQLIDAYVTGMATGSLQDNIQPLHTSSQTTYDSLLYSKPIVSALPDGVEKLEGIWNIYISRKEVVLEESRKN